MGDRNSFGYYSGRGSPFLSNLADAAPRNLSGHFEYIGPDDELYTNHRPAVAVYDGGDDPDKIHVRYLDRMIPIDFPAYSVNEETTCAGDLRKSVARHLGVDASRVRLVYKKHELKHNRYSLKRYGMKQNSEVSAVVTERSMDYNRTDSHSASGSDSESSSHLAPAPRRPRAQSSVRYRSDEQVPTAAPRKSASHLHPNGHVPTVSQPLRHPDSLRPTGAERVVARERDPSRSRGASPAPPTSHLPPADPNSPLGKMQALSSAFNTQHLPQATRFLMNPPSEPDVRQKEFLRLSESIMAQVILKADNIEIEGNADARNVRKNTVNEANRVLKNLDMVMKGN